MSQIRQSLNGYRDNLLKDIANTYNIPITDLQERYGNKDVTLPTAEPQKKKREVKEKPNAVMCKGLTAKGGACKFVACQGHEYCGIHLRKMGESSGTVTTSNKVQCKGKTAKGEPCKFLADPETCLCGTHLRKSGASPTAPTKGVQETTATAPAPAPATAPATAGPVPDLQARLAALLSEEDEEEEEPTISLEELIIPNKEEIMEKLREEDSDVEEDAIDQMCETPPSRQKLNELLGDI